MWTIALFLVTVFLAYANGANGNFKGVATLFGSNTANYKIAIWWATCTTFAGSISSIVLAKTLLKNFSGQGLVPEAIAHTERFHIAVAFGAGLAVILATVTGFPISTTHSLTGALTGAGLMAIGQDINFETLEKSFFLPLLVSPFIAIILGAIAYSFLRYLRISLGIDKAWCVCADNQKELVPIVSSGNHNIFQAVITPDVIIDTKKNCEQLYLGKIFGIDSQKLVDICHFLSAGIVSFARGLNDTPKIIALLLSVSALSIKGGMLAVSLGIAIGGLLNAKKVATTLSKKITNLNPGKGLSANLMTGFLVIFASKLGVPVSTTHVSAGSIFGVGVVSKSANVNVFSQIFTSWVLTLPVAAIFSAFTYLVLQYYK